MARSFALISLLVALAVGGYLYTESANETVGSSGDVVQDAATQAAADATLLAARTGLESFFAANSTYAGATVPAGVTVVAADAAAFCLQVGSGEAVRHLAGPGGSPAPGAC